MDNVEWLSRTLYTSPVCYALCLTEEAFAKECRRLGLKDRYIPPFVNPGADASAHHFDKGSDGRAACIIVTLSPSSKAEKLETVYGLLVHEAVHIWQEVRRNMGEKEPASEQEAYFIQALSQNLMQSYKRQTARKKPPKVGKTRRKSKRV